VLQALLNVHVFGAAGVVNREYEGEIRDYGDTVNIIDISNVSIKDYAKDTPIASPDTIDDNAQSLTIDQAKYFNFAIDDIDQVQTRPKLFDEAARTAAWGLSDKSDTDISDAMIADGNAWTTGSVSISDPSDAYEALVDAGVALSITNTPSEGRFAICPPDFYGNLQKDDRFVHATAQGDNVLANGIVGRAAGFTVAQSNNISGGANVVFGHPMATTFAEQILKTEAYRPQDMFADALKGLYVYGIKVVRPDNVGTFDYS
jgi:hypothetical protein